GEQARDVEQRRPAGSHELVEAVGPQPLHPHRPRVRKSPYTRDKDSWPPGTMHPPAVIPVTRSPGDAVRSGERSPGHAKGGPRTPDRPEVIKGPRPAREGLGRGRSRSEERRGGNE